MILNATQLTKFDLIRLPYRYPGEAAERKRFVFLFHRDNFAICLKTTSKVTLYLNDAALKAGVVFYPAGSTANFELDTAVQPDNTHPLSHIDIDRAIANGTFEHLGEMPLGFHEALIASIKASKTMKPDRKQNLLSGLGAN